MKRVIGIALLLVSIGAAVGLTAPAQAAKKASEVDGEVRKVFDKWSTALTRGDKKTYLDTFVTYERPAPGQASATGGEALVFRGTAVFTRTPDGWKIAAWHAHSVSDKSAN